MTDFSPSEEFADLFFLAIDHGFGSIESAGGPLIPLTLVVGASGEKKLTRFALERLEEGVEQAKASVNGSSDVRMYAIAWDGFVTLEGKKWDAILVEAGESINKSGVLFAQRYAPAKKGIFRKSKCERIGNPALIAHPPSRLWSGNA